MKDQQNPKNIRQDFKKLHEKDFYFSELKFFAHSLHLVEEVEASGLAKHFFQLELGHHRGNLKDVLNCLKANLGTTSNLFHLLKLVKEHPDRRQTISVYQKINRWLQGLNIISVLKFIFLTILKVILYYLDLFKDIFVLVAFSKDFQLNESLFKTFGFQIFALMSLSVILPTLANALVIWKLEPWTKMKAEKIILVLISPILPAAVIYIGAKYGLLKEELIQEYAAGCRGIFKVVDKLERGDKLISRCNLLLMEFKSNESSFEQFTQTVTLFCLTALKFSQTAMVTGMQDLLVGRDILLVIVSSIWSFISILRTYVQCSAIKKEAAFSFRRFLVHFSFGAMCVFFRITGVILFFAPALGIFNLMHHWKIGSLIFFEKRILVVGVADDGTLISAKNIWEQMKSYSDLIIWELDVYFKAFLAIIVIHFVCVTLIKVRFSKNFWSRKNVLDKVLHVLNQGELSTSP